MKIIIPIVAAALFVATLIVVPKLLHNAQPVQASDETCYWVGDANPSVWNDATHWSNASGGAGSTCAAPGSIPDSGTVVIFDGGKTTNVTVNADISIDSLNLQAAYTGTFDNATQDKSFNITGDVTMDSTRVDMGDATWTVGGNFDNFDVITFNRDASTLIMNGAGKQLTSIYNKTLNNFTIPDGASVTVALTSPASGPAVAGTATISGILTIATNEYFYLMFGTPDLKITSTGRISGYILYLSGNAKISQKDGVIDVIRLMISRNHTGAYSILPATYEAPNVWFLNDSNTNYTCELSAGTYVFNGAVRFYGNDSAGRTGTLTMNNAAHNPNMTFKGNVTFDNGYSSISWTRGTGTITLAGTGTQRVEFMNKSVENINVTSSKIVTFSSGLTTGSFIDSQSGSSLFFKAGSAYNIGTLGLAGTSNHNVSLGSSAVGNSWFLNVSSSSPKVSYLDVSDSNASGGSQIDASNCTNVDDGNNANWNFGSCNQTTTTTTTTTSTSTSSTPTVKNTGIKTLSAITAPANFAAIGMEYLPQLTMPSAIPAHGAVRIPIQYDSSIAVIVIVIDAKVYDLVPIGELAANNNIYYLSGLAPGSHALQYYGIDNLNHHTPLSATQDFFVSRALVGIFGFVISLWWLALIVPIILVVMIVLAWRKHQHLEDFRGRVEAFK